MKKYGILGIIFGLFLCVSFSGCGEAQVSEHDLKDGYYTAEMKDYNHGWKEFVTICVMDNKIVSVEYNARNAAGFIKSWDSAYMRKMNPVMGIYPNRYTRTYAAQFLEKQNAEDIDLLTGATSSGRNFQKLAMAVLDHAKTGDTQIEEVAGETEQE